MNNEIDKNQKIEEQDNIINEEGTNTNVISKGRLIFKLLLIWIVLVALGFMFTYFGRIMFLSDDECHSISCLGESLSNNMFLLIVCFLIVFFIGYIIVKDMYEEYSGSINYSFSNCVIVSLMIPVITYIVIGNLIYYISRLFS